MRKVYSAEKRLLYASLAVLMLLMASAALVQAGGWAVVTLDRLPGEAVVGQPFAISFYVRQHGLTLMEGLTPKITLSNRELGQTQRVMASALGDKGHYEATFTPAEAGTWTWSIDAFGAFPQPMPPLHVIAVAAPIQTAPARTATGAPNVNLTPALGWLTAALAACRRENDRTRF